MVKKQSRRDATFELSGDELPDIVAPEEEAVTDNAAELVVAVRGLSPKHRMVIELCYFEGRSLDEIGEIVDCPANTVKTRLHHARKKLRTIIEVARARLNAEVAAPNESASR